MVWERKATSLERSSETFQMANSRACATSENAGSPKQLKNETLNVRRCDATNDTISLFSQEFTYERDQTCYESEQNCYERAPLTAHAPVDAPAAVELFL